MRPHIAEITESLLDKCAQQGGMEVISDLASALPVQVLCDLMGLPPSDQPLLRRWADQLLGFQGINKPSLELLLAAQTAIVEIRDFLGDRVGRAARSTRAMTCSARLLRRSGARRAYRARDNQHLPDLAGGGPRDDQVAHR